MTKPPLKVGIVVDGTDHFVRPIEQALRRQHQVVRFAPKFWRIPLIGSRVNAYWLRVQLSHFLKSCDVVFFEWAGSLLVLACQMKTKGRIVTRLHSIELATAAAQVAWSKVNHTIVLNRHHLDRLKREALEPLQNVTIIANGVDLQRYQMQRHDFGYHFGMVCSLSSRKRVYEVILCLYQLRKDGFSFALHIAGSVVAGEEMLYLWAMENLVEKLGLGQNVFFEGHITDVPHWLHTIDIFISNSYWEGQQVALMEAMASGCYCLSHCWPGVEEILPAENIYMTDEDLRAKLVAYAALPTEAQLSEQREMRAIVEEKFDERRMVRQIVEIIEQAAIR